MWRGPGRTWFGTVLTVGLTLLTGCGGDGPPGSSDAQGRGRGRSAPAGGDAATLDVGSWNIEFFGDSQGGPSDDALQRRRAVEVIAGSELDFWGLQEISDTDDFAALLDGLPGYSGFLADDPMVAGGAESYRDFSNTEQKVGVVYRDDVVRILEARVILSELDYEFAGRPPLEVRTKVSVSGVTRDLVLIVLHAKANTQARSWERRRDAAEGLRDYLDRSWPDSPVVVVGDWNDDVDESIAAGRDTPYRGFVDAPEWTFVTKAISVDGVSSILGYSSMVDHILVSDEALAWYEEGSASIHEVDRIIPDFERTTSDHLPVLARFRLGG